MSDSNSGRSALKTLIRSVLVRLGLFSLAVSVVTRLRADRAARAVEKIEPRSPVPLPQSRRRIERPIVMASAHQGAAALAAGLATAAPDTIMLKAASQTEPLGAATLARPDPASLAGWLAQDQPALKAAIATFVADEASVGLLRGQMQADQHLLLMCGNGAGELPSAFGAPTWIEGDLAYFDAPPAVLRAPSEAGTAPFGQPSKADHWPKISMIMVSFNQAPFLEEGIRSILDQNYPNLEFIMIDGGSTDGSVAILERYRAHFAALVIEKDRGQSDGLTKGFDRATGEIVSWLNSDDLLIPGALFQVADAFRHHGVDVVAGGCRQVEENGVDIFLSHHNHLPFGRKVPLPLQDLLDFDGCWLKGCFFFQPEVFFTRDIWLRSGGGLRLDLYYVLDYDLWVRMAAAGATVVHIPAYLASSRIHKLQKTTFGETPFVPEARRLLAEYADGVHWKRPADS
jgi:GT2 family glycosyltransferase